MKQHITTEQLNELSEKGKEKLRKWWKPKKGDLSFEPIYSWSYQGYKKGYFHDYDRRWETEQVKGSINENMKDNAWVASCNHPVGKKSKITVKEKEYQSIVGEMINEDGDDYSPSERALPLLSIGVMIEFLDEQKDFEEWYEDILEPDGKDIYPKYKGELCDALWGAVKEVLK